MDDAGGEIVPRELDELLSMLELEHGRVLLLDADRNQVVFDRRPSSGHFVLFAFAVQTPASLEDLAEPRITLTDPEEYRDLSNAMERMLVRAGRTL